MAIVMQRWAALLFPCRQADVEMTNRGHQGRLENSLHGSGKRGGGAAVILTRIPKDEIRLQNNIIQVEERKEASKMMRDIHVAWFCSWCKTC